MFYSSRRVSSMAQTALGLNQKALHQSRLIVFLLIHASHAFEFKVGGPKASWAVPSDANATRYNQWAEKNRFQIGDTLLFVYPPDKDSVLQVTKEDYTNCKTEAPIIKFSDGHTLVKFNQSGPYYFISGVVDNCLKNEKLIVVVMADRSNHSKQTVASSPPPLSATSPPPSDEVEINPTLAPGQESPTNGGPSFDIGRIGVFLGSFVILVVSERAF